MTRFSHSSILRIALCCILIASVSMSSAQSSSQLDKHARKVYHKLSKYPSGQYLHLVLRNDTNSYGALGHLSQTSFTFTSADSNTTSTYAYSEIERVKTDKEGIGQGTEPHHFRHLVPIVIVASAVVAAGAIYAAER